MPESNEIVNLFIVYGLNVLGAIAILVIGWLIAGWAARYVRKTATSSPRIDTSLAGILAQITRIAILLLTLIAVLNRFGVQTTSLVAILGAAGLAIGLALQGTMSNVAAGVILLTLRPFNVGEAVDIGEASGTVEDLSLFSTELKTFDGLTVYVPNSQVWDNAITNYSRSNARRVELIFGVGYSDDADKAVNIINTLLAEEERVLAEPESRVAVTELSASTVNILCWAWVSGADFLDVKLELTKRVKERFDEAGISFPFPQQDVHVISGEPAAQEPAS